MVKDKAFISKNLYAQEPGMQMYDEKIKKFLSDVQVLARILKNSVEEFAPYSIEEIIPCISDVRVGEAPVDPMSEYSKARMESNEDYLEGEGVIRYDCLCRAYLPGDEEHSMVIIINLEAQRTMDSGKLGYHLVNRQVYYVSRLISAQKDTEFFGDDYDGIKKVKSIWICLVPNARETGIDKMRLVTDTIIGERIAGLDTDLVECITIRIHQLKEISKAKHQLIAMLETLIANVEPRQKLDELKENYGFVVERPLTKEMSSVCNLSIAVLEMGIEEGIERGITIAVKQMMREGCTDALIRAVFTTDQVSDEKIALLRREYDMQ